MYMWQLNFQQSVISLYLSVDGVYFLLITIIYVRQLLKKRHEYVPIIYKKYGLLLVWRFL